MALITDDTVGHTPLMGIRRLRASIGVMAGIVLTITLAGCRSHDEGAGTPRPSSSPSFTRVVADNGCNLHVAPIRLPRYNRPSFLSGPAAEPINTTKDSHGLPGYPRFPSVLDGLPKQGVEPQETVEGVFYFPTAVDGLTYDQLLSKGGVIVSASRVGRHLQQKLSHPPAALTHVQIGTSPGWLYQALDSGGGLVRRSVNWVTGDRLVMSVTAQRQPARLVSLARSLMC